MSLQRVAIIDDQIYGRETVAGWVEDLFDARPIPFEGPLSNPEELLTWIRSQQIDAVIIDHKLNNSGYSEHDGLHIAATLFERRMPTVLATSYERKNIKSYVWYGGKVPSVVRKGLLQATLPQAMELAQLRIQGKHTQWTEPYPTIVRINSVDKDEVGLIISAFSPHDGILVDRQELQDRLHCTLSEGLRFGADVNIGARTSEELYLENLRKLDEMRSDYAPLLYT